MHDLIEELLSLLSVDRSSSFMPQLGTPRLRPLLSLVHTELSVAYTTTLSDAETVIM